MNIDLEKLKQLASDLLPVDLIAILLDVDVLELQTSIADKGSDVSKTYYKGQAETIAAIRKQEVELAKAGSPMAVENVNEYIIEQKISENG